MKSIPNVAIKSKILLKPVTCKNIGISAKLFSTTKVVNNIVLVENKQGVRIITLNRPERFNSFNSEMFDTLRNVLNDTSRDGSVKLAVITGTGDYFTSGNDLANFERLERELKGDMNAIADRSVDTIQPFIGSLIDFQKPLIAAVNGPAIGIGATLLAHTDAVWASDSAYFYTPFTGLGIIAEACSSHTFPAIMGTIRANEMLMFNYKMGAQEARECGLVSRVVPKQEFRERVEEWVFGAKGLLNTSYPKSMQSTKQLLRNATKRQTLHAINAEECLQLRERMASDEARDAINKFMNRKKSAK
ncbi:unnamed protein product [Oppiella nova]|uniref:Uncharacterized protein n=1 Tax=Oppiella nova TaxID=334625 RepID=A0A7R9MDN6_9ACAR|nr:unnamed protein product [Oppiella nova]CAG2174443.1 unnamed protein product [Oppiella nova]